MKSLQKFASVPANVHNHFSQERHLEIAGVGCGLKYAPRGGQGDIPLVYVGHFEADLRLSAYKPVGCS